MRSSCSEKVFRYILTCDWPTGCCKIGNDNGGEDTRRGTRFEQEGQVTIYCRVLDLPWQPKGKDVFCKDFHLRIYHDSVTKDIRFIQSQPKHCCSLHPILELSDLIISCLIEPPNRDHNIQVLTHILIDTAPN